MISKRMKIQFLVFAIAISSMFVLLQPYSVYALSTEANAMCNPWYAKCGCMKKPGKNGCVPGKNTNKCPPGICEDVTNEGITKGICIAGNVCKGVSYSALAGQKGGLVDTGLKLLKSLIKKSTDSLNKATPTTTPGILTSANSFGEQGFNNTRSINLVGTQERRSATDADRLREISNSETNSLLNTLSASFGTDQVNSTGDADRLREVSNSETTSLLNTLSSGSSGLTEDTENTRIAFLGNSEGKKTSPDVFTRVLRQVGEGFQNTTGNSVGEGEITSASDVRTRIRSFLFRDTRARETETEGGDTLRTESVDEVTNTGFGSFFGVNAPRVSAERQRASTVGRLCTAQPWQTSFVSRIFSSGFFDSLCERRGFVPGGQEILDLDLEEEPVFINESLGRAQISCSSLVGLGDEATIEWSCGGALRSSGVNFETLGVPDGTTNVAPTENTTYTLECSQGGSASCTVRVISPELEIVAHPQRVPLGSRTRLYWVGENVSSCAVTGLGMDEDGLRGTATTNSILDRTTFTLTCETQDGSVFIEETFVDVGI